MTFLYMLGAVLCMAGTLLTLLGAYTFIMIFIVAKKAPADSTNRINHLRVWFFALKTPWTLMEFYPWLKNNIHVWWVALTAPWRFIEKYPWLARDERFNLRDEDKRPLQKPGE